LTGKDFSRERRGRAWKNRRFRAEISAAKASIMALDEE
jgi:hypothetical protein